MQNCAVKDGYGQSDGVLLNTGLRADTFFGVLFLLCHKYVFQVTV